MGFWTTFWLLYATLHVGGILGLFINWEASRSARERLPLSWQIGATLLWPYVMITFAVLTLIKRVRRER